MKPGGESAAGANWGSIQMRFDCTAKDTLATCPIYTNQKFNTVRNFTHYIRPGDHVVKVDDTSTIAAIRPDARTATSCTRTARRQRRTSRSTSRSSARSAPRPA